MKSNEVYELYVSLLVGKLECNYVTGHHWGKLSGVNIWSLLFPICRWYHSNGRKWRGTKVPLDEGERGERNSWLEPQY